MASPRRMPIFDGHNDVLLRLYRRGGTDGLRAFLEGVAQGHLDFRMARQEGGFAGGLFAIFVPSSNGATGQNDERPLETSMRTPRSCPPFQISCRSCVRVSTASR